MRQRLKNSANAITSEERREIAKLSRELDAARAALKRDLLLADEADQQLQAATAARELIQAAAADVQRQAHEQIASVVSRCLQDVMQEPYEFAMEFEQKRGRTEAVLYVVKDGALRDPRTECGGGVCDVAAFACRVASLMLMRPALSRLLIMDEPFKWLSPNLVPNARQLLEMLSEELGIQIILVTHLPELELGTIVEL